MHTRGGAGSGRIVTQTIFEYFKNGFVFDFLAFMVCDCEKIEGFLPVFGRMLGFWQKNAASGLTGKNSCFHGEFFPDRRRWLIDSLLLFVVGRRGIPLNPKRAGIIITELRS